MTARTYIYSDSLSSGGAIAGSNDTASLQELLKLTDFTDDEVDEIIELQPGETWQAPDRSINIQRTPSSVHGDRKLCPRCDLDQLDRACEC